MPRNDGTGPPKTSHGPKDGRGGGRGNNVKKGTGTGSKTGGGKGSCT